MSKFKGWDYIELAEHWGLEYQNVENECELIRDYIYSKATFDNAASEQQRTEMKQTADDIREYLKALAQYNTYEKPVWEGLLDVEDDFTFLRFSADLLPHMWV